MKSNIINVNKLKTFIKNFNGKIIFFILNETNHNDLLKKLFKINIKITIIKNINNAKKIGCFLIKSFIEKGFINNNKKIAIICENDLIDGKNSNINKFIYENSFKKEKNNKFIIDNLNNLKIGQPLIHVEYGVGRYCGLKILENKGIKTEYLILIYANNAKLYIPINSLDLIKKYINTRSDYIPIHTLGNESWLRSRKKAVLKIKDIAAELLEIYAKRSSQIGFSFKLNIEKYKNFCNLFPFNLTLDQKNAIKDVLYDMQKLSSMDRVICGDVGFGKTEVAMRAAFLAVENKKQVAILTPTTLLAKQHFNNFKKRFKKYIIKIEMLSRFRSHKEEKIILKNLSVGKIDILIGTHKILNNNVKWFDLGLLVIDEEHRFGVHHKDSIKKIKLNIDVLTLTATPIPRTLNMAISGIRDLSIISTPPERRLEIKTFVCKYDKKKIKNAILKEILRKGQVYYLCNNIKNINKTAEKLKKLVPTSEIAVGHGKMNKRELELVINDFYHNKFNVLVCTTIMETGIDISNANTIIIERADKFGLAQLHQLKGRVGRSDKQAYAWLFTPNNKKITINAQKRLEASELEKLGSGFIMSMQDLEIRGSGDILGVDQSGQETLGFHMYMETLNNAILSIKSGKNIEESKKVEIELQITSIIPNSFINNINTRLSFYKKISNANNEKELYDIKYELINDFGKLPEETNNLLDLSILKINAIELGIKRIEMKKNSGFIEFNNLSDINYDFLVTLLKKHPKDWKVDNNKKTLSFVQKKDINHKNRIDFIKKIIYKMR